MKVKIFRNGSWFGGLCLDEVTIKTDERYKDINSIYQEDFYLKKLGYEIEDLCNNPFTTVEQFEYRNEYDDKVVVRFDFDKEKPNTLYVLKQYNEIENCSTTVEVITRLGALNKLQDDIVKIFTDCYGVPNNDSKGE